jgi:adenosylhomocysteine nucleosidase
MKYLSVNKPDIIINLGTAGSTAFRRGDVVCCTQFVQRDMDVSPLGIEKFKTPFSDDDVVLDYGIDIDNLPKGICGTGDSFETEHNTDLYNVLDMEAYALALIAKREQIPFLCLKYISDGANDDAVED